MQNNDSNQSKPSDQRQTEINDHDQPGGAGQIKHILKTGLPPALRRKR